MLLFASLHAYLYLRLWMILLLFIAYMKTLKPNPTSLSSKKGRLLSCAIFAMAVLHSFNVHSQDEKNVYDESRNQATFYVSPIGNDTNDGSFSAPFKTLSRAQKAVREVNTSMSGDVVVCMRGGTYQLTNTLRLDNTDGGKNGHYVRYRNYPGETPLVTGGMPIENWTLHDERNNIWAASDVEARFRQIYVNGKKAVRARYPNLKEDGGHDFFRLAKVDTFGKGFEVFNDQLGDWKHLDKVEMHLMIAWAESILRLSKITNKGNNRSKIEVQEPEHTMIWRRKYPMLGTAFMSNPPRQQCFYFENAYEFIDQEGEWYLDEYENTLYYKAHEGEDMNKSLVVAPRLETLVSIQGESTSSKVGYISFEGITFAHTNFTLPSEKGYMDLQAGLYHLDVLDEHPGVNLSSNKFLLKRPASGFSVENAHHIRVENNVFSQMAMTGLDFISGTNDDMIQGNVFADLGAAGIMIGKFSASDDTEIHIPYNPSDKAEICTRDTIMNNYIHHVTTESQGSVGIGAGYPRDIVIEHNELAYMNYSGISVGFGWTKEPTAMNNNHINWNRIHHVSQLLADCGPIYTLSNQGNGGEIMNNYITDISASSFADYWVLPVYLDEGSSGFEVANNVYDRAPSGNASNQPGYNNCHDNSGHDPNVVQNAGIQSGYKNILSKEINVIPDFSEIVPQAPFKEGVSLPGIVQMEDYDFGGQSVSFYDKDFINEGKYYREDGVDIVAIGDSLNPDGYAIGYTAAGEWLEYTLAVRNTAKYDFLARVASGLEHSGFRLFMDGAAISDTIEIPQCDSWNDYIDVKGSTSELEEGDHVLRLLITGSYANIDYIKFAPVGQALETGLFDLPNDGQLRVTVYNVSGLAMGEFTLPDVLSSSSLRALLESKGFAPGVYLIHTSDNQIVKHILY